MNKKFIDDSFLNGKYHSKSLERSTINKEEKDAEKRTTINYGEEKRRLLVGIRTSNLSLHSVNADSSPTFRTKRTGTNKPDMCSVSTNGERASPAMA